MRKLFIGLIVCASISCNSGNESKQEDKTITASASVASESEICRQILLLADQYITQEKEVIATIDKNLLTEPINIQAAKRYINHYRKDSAALKKIQGTDYTSSVWIDKKTLANFLLLCITDGADGARLYFSKYDTSYKDPVRDRIYGNNSNRIANKHSVVIVAGRQNANGSVTELRVPLPGTLAAQGIYRSIDNYNDPCPPTCDGLILTDGQN